MVNTKELIIMYTISNILFQLPRVHFATSDRNSCKFQKKILRYVEGFLEFKKMFR